MATQSIFNMIDTWNNGATVFTAVKMNVTDTASNAASLLMDLQVGGVSQFSVSKAGALTGLSNVLEVRNSTTAQTFRVYGTYTDSSNYERLSMSYTASQYRVATEQLGTGIARQLRLEVTGADSIIFATSSSSRWSISSAGHFLASTDNTIDIGASGATRPRNLYMASWIRMATTVVASLPAAATAGAGARMFVTDALAPVFGSAVAGSGAVTVPVYSTGAAWNVG